MYFAGVIGVLIVMILAAIVSGLNPLSLIDAASFMIVLLPALLAALAAAKSGELRFLTAALFGGDLNEQQRAKAARLFRLMGNVALGAGFVGLVIALIQIMQNLPAGDKSLDAPALGRAFAAALMTPFYGLFFKFFIFEPAATRAE